MEPLKKFGANFISKSGKLDYNFSTNNPKPINFIEKKGSAQIK